MDRTRRAFILASVAAMVGIAGCGSTRGEKGSPAATSRFGRDLSPPTTDRGAGLPIRLRTITSDIKTPLDFQEAPDGTRYVADRSGRIFRIDADGGVSVALDLSQRVVVSFEQGLLGLALHPDFASNGRAFVRYSSPPRPGTPAGHSHTFVLSEFRVPDGTTRFDPGSERVLLEIPQPQPTHNSGAIVFGPDGYLYVGVGDGGGRGDAAKGHVTDWYGSAPGGNGQDISKNILGSILRIDVNRRQDGRPYAIPPDNPLVGLEGSDEQFAWGFRNPWRMSFASGELLVADVGQARYEEVNVVVKGGNYGWNVREGSHCFQSTHCPVKTADGDPLRGPIIEYPHANAPVSGAAVIGGHVYEGNAVPALRGQYVFGDWLARGRLFVASPAERSSWPTEVLSVARQDRKKVPTLFAIGEDRDGELYVLSEGGVHRIEPSKGKLPEG